MNAQNDNPENKPKSNKEYFQLQIEFLEKRYSDAISLFQITLGAITVIFILIGFFSYSARQEVSDDTRYMQQQVSEAIDKMELNFQRLSGEALKKADVVLKHANAFLDSSTVTVRQGLNGACTIDSLYMENRGDRSTDALSIKLYLTGYEAGLDYTRSMSDWKRVDSPSTNFTSVFWLTRDITISPQESWFLPDLFAIVPTQSNGQVHAMLEVFYGAEKPATAQFTIQMDTH